jgi:small RNA 2'-O-methyltransferase
MEVASAISVTDEPSALHEERMAAVTGMLLTCGATSVVDLGCGTGALLERLSLDRRYARLAGLDASAQALATAERRLKGAIRAGRAFLCHGSFDAPDPRLAGFDAALMVETIEHLDPRRLSALEHVLFRCYSPRALIITTPNREYNALYGMREDALRHPGHRFEWTRSKLRRWAHGTAARNGYGVTVSGIGAPDPLRGSPTQMASFTRDR